jgi:hypothetical protein
MKLTANFSKRREHGLLHTQGDGFVGGVRLSPLGTAATTGLLYQPQMIVDDDCGPIGGMKIGKGNRSTRRNPVPDPLCPPQIPHDLTQATRHSIAAAKFQYRELLELGTWTNVGTPVQE